MKTAFLFSGQGAQYPLMGKELYDNFEIVKDTFDEADATLGYKLTEFIFNEDERLNETLYTQLAIYVLEVAIKRLLNQKGIVSDYTCGLSLGEYGAYLDSGVFDFKEGLEIIKNRAFFMNEAAKDQKGAMSAILGLDELSIKNVIDVFSNRVSIANYNTYGQIVITGEKESVLKANELLLEAGAKRAILLKTSGAFHSIYMKQAEENFSKYLVDVNLNEPNNKLLINTTGDFYMKDIKNVMSSQITSSVMFYQIVEKMIDKGVTNFIEIGPGKSISGFVKKIDRKLNILNVEDIASLNRTLEKVKEN